MICIPIQAETPSDALEKIGRANRLGDMLELRVDLFGAFDLRQILSSARKPVIVTYRSIREGGKGVEDDESRARFLLEAIELGADFVDVEFSMPSKLRSRIFEASGPSRTILSAHLFEGTPPMDELRSLFSRMTALKPGVVKIVTHAKMPEDTLRVLGLIPLARERGIRVIAFCMGPRGRFSRIASLFLGGFLTFASLEEGEESAEGQIPVLEMKKILRMLGK